MGPREKSVVWTVLAHLDDLALDKERVARHVLDDAQVDDKDVARDDPAVEGIVLHDGRERMVFAERNADSAAFEHPGGVDEHGEGHDGVGELPHEQGALERRAARSCELEGPVLREAQNGVDARRRERSRHARAGRAALVVAKADPGTARNGKTPVARRHFKTPDRGIERKGGVRAALEPLLEGKDLDETVGEKAGGAGDRVDDAVGETGDLVLERAPDPEAELEASAFGLRDGKTRLDAVGIDQTVEEPERVAQREKRRRKTVRAEGSVRDGRSGEFDDKDGVALLHPATPE